MKRALLALIGLAAVVPLGVGASDATFVAASANPGTSFSTAADFNTVAVALADPGGVLRGSVALSATAASDRGVARVTFQSSPAGADTWTDVCVAATAPYTCSFDTTKVADGLRDLRAVALDGAGYSRTAVLAGRRVDNTAPATALTDPGTPLTGTKTLTATATDGGSGVASVALQYRVGAGAWTTICAQASCAFNTAALPDGLYDLRSLVTDAAGNTSASVVANRRVDNTAPAVTVSSPGSAGGTLTLSATVDDGAGAGVTSVRYQFRASGGTTWSDVCTVAAAPFTCAADTTGVADGLYEARAIATDGAGFSTTSATVTVRVDNAAPAVTLTDPGSPLSGSVTLAATATDAGSGVASVRFERAPAGTSTWTALCTDAGAPYTCAWTTTAEADGRYDVRAVAADAAGNTRTSAVVTSRLVDNGGPAVTLADPGSPLRGSVSLSATASDPAGVASVRIERGSGGAWTTICTDATASYSCTWATSGVADGAYDLRAVAVDTLGHSTTSAVVAARTVDNTAPGATDVQAVNGGAAGRIDAGDVLIYSFSEPIAPASILAGWTGTATTVSVRVNNVSASDTLTVFNAANTTQLALGTVALKADHTAAGARLVGTMTISGSQVSITLGAVASGSTRASSGTPAMTWTPSTAATDLAGNPAKATAVTESGTADRDF